MIITLGIVVLALILGGFMIGGGAAGVVLMMSSKTLIATRNHRFVRRNQFQLFSAPALPFSETSPQRKSGVD